MDEHERAEEQERLSHEGAECTRTGAIEFARAKDDAEGSFQMTLATDGEASDGHILSVRGAQIPESGRIPMLLGHYSSDEIPALGSVTDFRKGRGTPSRLRARGRFNLEGGADDGLLPTRRGVFNLVQAGDLPAVSVRWRGIKQQRRTELPKGHAAHVKADEPDVNKRYGMFFERWSPLEGSIVAVGADPQALIGRARALGPEVERLVRTMDLPGRAEPDAVRDGLVAAVDAARATGLDEAGVSALLAGIIGTEAQVPLVRYLYLDGAELRECWLPEVARDALQGESREALSEVLDAVRAMGERMTPPTPPASREAAPAKPRPAPTPAPVISPKPRTVSDLTERELTQGIASAVGSAVKQALEPLAAGRVRR